MMMILVVVMLMLMMMMVMVMLVMVMTLVMMNLVHGNDDGTLGDLEPTKEGFPVKDSSGADSYRTQSKTILFSFYPLSSIYIFRQQRPAG